MTTVDWLKASWWHILAGSITGLLVAGFALWWFYESPILSPLTSSSTFRFLTGQTPVSQSNKVVYGFIPYWNLADVTIQPELTQAAYFSLAIGPDGKVIIRDSDGNVMPGYQRLGNESFLDKFSGFKGKVEIVFTQFDNDDTVAFLTSSKAQDEFLVTLDSALLAYPFSGVNIDIEYTGEVTDTLRADFVQFLEKLRHHVDQTYDHIQISVDMYASAASREMIWDIPALEPYVDYIVVMAYDFHRRSSVQAGPVAPIFGGKELWDSDISGQLKAFLESVPPEKILLGIPFYGYEWQTTSRDAQAHTFPQTGATASYSRVQQLLAQRDALKVQEHWNEDALSPYISYEEDGEIYVVYYENSRSISYKLDLVNQLNLGGIAIWALGYEGNSRELWEVIGRKL